MTTATLTNPPEIAREAIKQLALRKMPPTPDNYARLYGEVSGVKDESPRVTQEPAQTADAAGIPDASQWTDALRDFLRAWDASIPGFTQARKREAIERLLQRRSPNVTELHKRFKRLVKSWGEVATPSREAVDGTVAVAPTVDTSMLEVGAQADNKQAVPLKPEAGDKPRADFEIQAAPESGANAKPQADQESRTGAKLRIVESSVREEQRILRGLLAEAVENAVSARQGYAEKQVAQGAALAAELRDLANGPRLTEQAEKLRQFWLTLEAHGAGLQEVVTGLTLLLQLLLSNIAELTSDDRWLKGQLAKLHSLVSGPMNVHSLVDAHRGMREVITRQGTLKHSLDEARQALKEMLASFIDRLGKMTVDTGDFQGKIEGYVARIEATDDFTRLSEIARDLLSDTRGMQTDIARTHGDLHQAQKRAEEYEARVHALESRLEEVSGLVCEDPLTSALNRRGLDEALEKEAARCERNGQPLCIAMLDVDNFKSLNDKFGHQAGDYALMHLADVVREAIRPTDVLGRYGGEEFVILLPNTSLEAAEAATVRVQRALTRRFFMHNNERLLITFSAGVAQFVAGESRDKVLDRADRSLYEAKRTGKNRVVLADPPPAELPQATPPAGSRAHNA